MIIWVWIVNLKHIVTPGGCLTDSNQKLNPDPTSSCSVWLQTFSPPWYKMHLVVLTYLQGPWAGRHTTFPGLDCQWHLRDRETKATQEALSDWLTWAKLSWRFPNEKIIDLHVISSSVMCLAVNSRSCTGEKKSEVKKQESHTKAS